MTLSTTHGTAWADLAKEVKAALARTHDSKTLKALKAGKLKVAEVTA